MEPVQPFETPTPTLDTDVLAVVPSDAAPAEVATVETPVVAAVVVEEPPAAPFESLYDGPATAVLAILLGAGIVASIQVGVQRMFAGAKTESSALTSFATSMCAIIVAIWACDMLVAGPHSELLSEQERLTILSFVKDITMLVFAYYFGTKSTSAS